MIFPGKQVKFVFGLDFLIEMSIGLYVHVEICFSWHFSLEMYFSPHVPVNMCF